MTYYLSLLEHCCKCSWSQTVLKVFITLRELTASFRGHSLDGVKMLLPDGYRGLVVTEVKKPLAEDADRRFQVAGGFKEITYWNWDKKPSKNDNLVKAMDWMDIAEAIHGD
ncbi:hypothetical protein ACJJTC_003512 [Scirpophaga incertulas]